MIHLYIGHNSLKAENLLFLPFDGKNSKYFMINQNAYAA